MCRSKLVFLMAMASVLNSKLVFLAPVKVSMLRIARGTACLLTPVYAYRGKINISIC